VEGLDVAIDEGAGRFSLAQGLERQGRDIQIDVAASAGEDDVQVSRIRIVVRPDDGAAVGFVEDHASGNDGPGTRLRRYSRSSS
jgi:hypothetical protein